MSMLQNNSIEIYRHVLGNIDNYETISPQVILLWFVEWFKDARSVSLYP